MSRRGLMGIFALCLLIVAIHFLRSRLPKAPAADGRPAAVSTRPIDQPANDVGQCAAVSCQASAEKSAVPAAVENAAPAVSTRAESPPNQRVRPLVNSMPRLSAMREQAARNPHAMPTALMEFSFVLAKRYETAVRSETAATRFFPELETCALQEPANSSASARGLCIVKARELAGQYPILKREFENLRARADAESLRLAHQLRE